MKKRLRILATSGLFCLLTLDLLSVAAEAQHVEIILDGSGSMWGETDNGKVKIALAKQRLKSLITGTGLSQASTIGLITYGHRSKGECSDIERFPSVPYANRSQLLPLIENIQPKGMTPIAGALRIAGDAIKSIEKRAEVVLISDGIEECGDDPCKVAHALCHEHAVDIRVHTVAFALAKEIDKKKLECISREGCGRHFDVSTEAEFIAALEEVSEEIGTAPPPPPLPPPPPTTNLPFEDNFDGREELGNDYEVTRPDSNRLVVSDGLLYIVATAQSKSGSQPGTFPAIQAINTTYLKQPLTGNFVATTKLSMKVEEAHRAGLVYKVDEKNFLFLGLWGMKVGHSQFGYGNIFLGGPRRRLVFTKVLGGKVDNKYYKNRAIGKRALRGYASEPEVWYIRLERKGPNYTGRISTDGKKWETIGSHVLVQKKGQLGLTAYLDWERGNENPAEFDNFVVKPK